MTISVLAPCRGRPDQVRRMVDSALAFASAPADVELVLRVDFDDDVMLRWLREEVWTAPVVIGPQYGGYRSLPRFINEAARFAQGDLLLVVNDDAEFQTRGWDRRLAAHAAAIPDGVFNFGVETANAGNFIFPCVSRRLVQLLGCLYDERLIYTDIWLRDVLAPFGRAIRVGDVTIAHHWAGMTPDQQQAQGETLTGAYQARYHQCVDEGRAKVRAALERAA